MFVIVRFFILSEKKDYNLFFEIIRYDLQIPLSEQKAINPNNGELRYFRNWSYVKEEDIKHIKIFKRMEEGEIFFLSSTDEFMPWWLKEEMQSELSLSQTDINNNISLNEPQQQQDHATSSSHLTSNSSEITENSEKNSVYNFRVSIKPRHQVNPLDATFVLEEFENSREDVDDNEPGDENRHEKVNDKLLPLISNSMQHLSLCQRQPEAERMANHNRSESIISSSMCLFREQKYKKTIADCKTVKKFVDEILDRDKYYTKKAEEEVKLSRNFEDAAIKTEFEKLNLKSKRITNQRYAAFIQRLSTNSKTVTDEAVAARDHYNKNAKIYNDTTKALKEIKTSTGVQNALTNLLVFKDNPKQIKAAPYYNTARDFYSCEEYGSLIKRISDQ